ncbi:restriction endonuclease [Janibacter sp. Y6]|uniref:restriction endonuclease n=1 Tax=Janibacter sp. Y6 TaxID=2913552 RepID=UPI0034A4EC2E
MVAMPAWDHFMVPMLDLLSDGQARPLREIRDRLMESTLTDDQGAERLPSGQPKADNRIGWAASYLSRVGAVERPTRGQYTISDVGQRMLHEHPTGISERELRAYAQPGDTWWASTSAGPTPSPSPILVIEESEPLDPIEQIETGIARVHETVAADLLRRLHGNQPAFFEQAVLDLLMAMGYGGTEGRATRTQLVGDGGIDGIVDQDALGLSRIYVQAKRYALDSAVGRPEIQGFVGALHGNQANQGVFITTGRFSSGARSYAETIPTRVVLIGGARLATLMIRYGVGVQVRRTVQIVEVDEDFFE